MKPVFQHQLLTSFYLWFDSFLCRKGEAYETFTTNFYYYSDEQITNKTVFGSPYKQFVCDKSISGSVVLENVSGDGVSYSRGDSGLIFDYENGRILLDSGFTTGTAFSGRYSVKNFNIYVSNQDEESLIMDQKYETNSRYTKTLTYVDPYSQVAPCVFLSVERSKNEPFALGGEDNTVSRAKAVVLSDNLYDLDGILSVFADSNKEIFANIPFTGAPLDEYGDIKTEHYPDGYNYTGLASNYDNDIYLIDSVQTSKLSDKITRISQPNLYVGLIDFDIHKYRFPRS